MAAWVQLGTEGLQQSADAHAPHQNTCSLWQAATVLFLSTTNQMLACHKSSAAGLAT
jgi:hypothetical protein